MMLCEMTEWWIDDWGGVEVKGGRGRGSEPYEVMDEEAMTAADHVDSTPLAQFTHLGSWMAR